MATTTKTAGGRTVRRTTQESKTITRPAGKTPAAPAQGAKAARGARTAVTRAPKAPKPEAKPAPADAPTAAAEPDPRLTALQSERDQVQQQHDAVKDLPQYAQETATLAARLAELDAQIKGLEPPADAST